MQKYPFLQWHDLNLNDTDFWDFIAMDLKRKHVDPGQSKTFLFYFKQKYDWEKEYDYLTCLIELCPTYNIVDWDYDEGQTDRVWLAYLDLSEVIMPNEN